MTLRASKRHQRSRYGSILPVAAVLAFLGFASDGTWAQVQLLNDLTAHFVVAPGGTYRGSLLLENTGDRAESVRIYQTDFWFDGKGRSHYPEPGTLARSNAPWIQLGQSLVTVAPHTRAAVVYQISVPDDQALTGTYWSMIMVELSPAQHAGSPPAPGQVGLAQRFRYAVQVVTDVGDTGRARLAFREPRLLRSGETDYRFRVELVNDGDRWIAPAVWMELYNGSGTRLSRFDGGQVRLYPGTSTGVGFSLGSLEPGRYLALLIADGGTVRIFGARYTLDIPSP